MLYCILNNDLENIRLEFETFNPVDSLSGSFTKSVNNHSSATQVITFETPFNNIPSVTAKYTNAISSTHAGNISVNVSDITVAGFTVKINNASTANFTFVIEWVAYASAK